MSHSHFSKTEYLEISVLLKKGYSHREIGFTLGKHHSSVSREIKLDSANGEYNPLKTYAKRKYSKYRGMKINSNSWLEEYIKIGLTSKDRQSSIRD